MIMKIIFNKFLLLVKQLQILSFISGFLTIPLFISIFALAGFFSPQQTAADTEVITVGRRDIAVEIKALGKVTLANAQQLRFNVLGKVAKVHVKEGDRVKKDDLIAELDKSEPLADVRSAQLSLGDAALRLKELQADIVEQKLSATNAVSETERQLKEQINNFSVEKQQVDFDILQLQRQLEEKELAMAQAERDLLKTTQMEVINLAAEVSDALSEAESTLDSLYKVMRGDGYVRSVRSHKETTFKELVFVSRDENLASKARYSFYDAQNILSNIYSACGDSIETITDIEVLTDCLLSVSGLFYNIIELSDNLYGALQMGAPTPDYTVTDFTDAKNTVNSLRQSALSVLNKLEQKMADATGEGKSGKISFNDLITVKQKEDALQNARQTLENTKEDLQVLLMKKEKGLSDSDNLYRDIQKMQEDLQLRETQLNNTDTSIKVQLNQQKNTIAQRSVSVEKAERNLEKYELYAPFDGLVKRVDFQVGDNLLADEDKFVVLENPAYFIITVQLDQIDIIHVKEGQKAYISLDALPDKQLEGMVDTIDTTPIENSGVVSYEVEIALQPTGDTILSGMTAKVEIVTESKESALAIPVLAINKKGDRPTVTSADGFVIVVETGISDGSFTEIISGLNEGDKILSQSVQFSGQTGTAINENRPLGMPMGAGAFRAGPGR